MDETRTKVKKYNILLGLALLYECKVEDQTSLTYSWFLSNCLQDFQNDYLDFVYTF